MASIDRAYSYVFGILRRNKRLLAITGVVALLEAGLQLIYPWLSRFQLEALEGQRSSLTTLLTTPGAVFLGVVVLILLAHLVTTLLGAVGRLAETYVRERMGIDTDRVLYDKMEQLDAGFLENPKNRRLIYIFFDISILPHSFVEFCSSVVKTVISVVGILPIIALTDLRVGGVIAGFGLLQVWLLRLRMRKENAYRLYKERAMAGINELIFLLRHRFHQLLGASGEARIMPKFWDKRREALALEVKQTKIAMTYELLNHLIENLSLFGAALFVGWRVLAGEMTVGAFVMVTLYTAQLQSSLSAINMNVGEWYRLRSIFLQLGFFLTMRPRVALEQAEAPEAPLCGDLTLDEVCFRYPHLQREEQAYIGYLVQQLDLDNAKREVWPGDYDLVREWRLLLEQNQQPFEPVLSGVSCQIPPRGDHGPGGAQRLGQDHADQAAGPQLRPRHRRDQPGAARPGVAHAALPAAPLLHRDPGALPARVVLHPGQRLAGLRRGLRRRADLGGPGAAGAAARRGGLPRRAGEHHRR